MIETTSPAAQLAALCAEPQVFTTSAGEAVAVAPIRVRQLAAVVRAAEPLFGELAGLGAMPQDMQGTAFVQLLLKRCDDVAALVAALVGRPVEWVGELDLDDLAGLAGLAIEVNADFFAHRLRPTIERLGAAMARSLGAAADPGQAGSA